MGWYRAHAARMIPMSTRFFHIMELGENEPGMLKHVADFISYADI